MRGGQLPPAGEIMPALVRADVRDRQLICYSGYTTCGCQMFCTRTGPGKSLVQTSVSASTLKYLIFFEGTTDHHNAICCVHMYEAHGQTV